MAFIKTIPSTLLFLCFLLSSVRCDKVYFDQLVEVLKSGPESAPLKSLLAGKAAQDIEFCSSIDPSFVSVYQYAQSLEQVQELVKFKESLECEIDPTLPKWTAFAFTCPLGMLLNGVSIDEARRTFDWLFCEKFENGDQTFKEMLVAYKKQLYESSKLSYPEWDRARDANRTLEFLVLLCLHPSTDITIPFLKNLLQGEKHSSVAKSHIDKKLSSGNHMISDLVRESGSCFCWTPLLHLAYKGDWSRTGTQEIGRLLFQAGSVFSSNQESRNLTTLYELVQQFLSERWDPKGLITFLRIHKECRPAGEVESLAKAMRNSKPVKLGEVEDHELFKIHYNFGLMDRIAVENAIQANSHPYLIENDFYVASIASHHHVYSEEVVTKIHQDVQALGQEFSNYLNGSDLPNNIPFVFTTAMLDFNQRGLYELVDNLTFVYSRYAQKTRIYDGENAVDIYKADMRIFILELSMLTSLFDDDMNILALIDVLDPKKMICQDRTADFPEKTKFMDAIKGRLSLIQEIELRGAKPPIVEQPKTSSPENTLELQCNIESNPILMELDNIVLTITNPTTDLSDSQIQDLEDKIKELKESFDTLTPYGIGFEENTISPLINAPFDFALDCTKKRKRGTHLGPATWMYIRRDYGKYCVKVRDYDFRNEQESLKSLIGHNLVLLPFERKVDPKVKQASVANIKDLSSSYNIQKELSLAKSKREAEKQLESKKEQEEREANARKQAEERERIQLQEQQQQLEEQKRQEQLEEKNREDAESATKLQQKEEQEEKLQQKEEQEDTFSWLWYVAIVAVLAAIAYGSYALVTYLQTGSV